MKKLTVFLLTLMLALFVGCSAGTPPQNQDPSDETQQTTPNEGELNGGEQSTPNQVPDKEEITKMFITVNGNKLEVTLESNVAVTALAELLKQGDIVYTADDYGGFEKVGSLGHSLPRSDKQIKTEAGDVVLYQGNQICIFVGSNSWSYTKLGRINGYSVSELKTLLGAGQGKVQITLSLE